MLNNQNLRDTTDSWNLVTDISNIKIGILEFDKNSFFIFSF